VVLSAALTLIAPLMAPPVAAAAPFPQAPVDAIALTSAVEPAVARIDTTIPSQSAIGTGTGVVIDAGGAVLTNFHVVQGAQDVGVNVAGRSFAADLLGYSRGDDIAVLQLRGASGLPVAPLGDIGEVANGEQVVALGNAEGSARPLTREAGTVTGLDRSITAEDDLTGADEQLNGLIEFAAPVRAGDSGGPVVDDAGRVVGITTAATVNYRMGPAGQGFAIPINRATAIANQIRSGAPSDTIHIGPPSLLGVGIPTAGRGDQRGVRVSEVLSGGPADQVGIRGGDLLTTVGGVPVDSATALTDVLDRRYPGDAVDVTWIDQGGQQRSGAAVLIAAA
jgi:serine protease Do